MRDFRSFPYLIESLFFGLVGYFHMKKSPQGSAMEMLGLTRLCADARISRPIS